MCETYECEDCHALADDCYRAFEDSYIHENPVSRHIRGVSFVSRSKGKNRKRNRITEVTLLSYDTTYWRFTSVARFPFDTVSTEIYGETTEVSDGIEAERRLMREVEQGIKDGLIRPKW